MNVRPRVRKRRGALPKTHLVAALLLAAACAAEAPSPVEDQGGPGAVPGGGGAPPAAPSPQTGEPPGSLGTAPPPGGQSGGFPDPHPPTSPPDAWTIGSLDADAVLQDSSPAPVVRALRTGTNDGFDRLTIELGDAPGLPGYRVEYVDRPLIQCGSGNQIFPVGDAWLEVRLEPAQAHTEEGRPTLPGREIPAEQTLMRRIYLTCDFEGVVTVVVALESPKGFRVSTLSEPRRIVVDVRH